MDKCRYFFHTSNVKICFVTVLSSCVNYTWRSSTNLSALEGKICFIKLFEPHEYRVNRDIELTIINPKSANHNKSSSYAVCRNVFEA